MNLQDRREEVAKLEKRRNKLYDEKMLLSRRIADLCHAITARELSTSPISVNSGEGFSFRRSPSPSPTNFVEAPRRLPSAGELNIPEAVETSYEESDQKDERELEEKEGESENEGFPSVVPDEEEVAGDVQEGERETEEDGEEEEEEGEELGGGEEEEEESSQEDGEASQEEGGNSQEEEDEDLREDGSDDDDPPGGLVHSPLTTPPDGADFP